jgi:enamine deaminase RidA (YjgF/YER057c/UK114 family)
MEIQRSPVVIAGQNKYYAKGTAVIGGRGTVYLSGAVGIDPGMGQVPEAIGEQARLALEAIKARLEEYGSELKYILHIWYYVKGEFPGSIATDPGWQEISQAIQQFWRKNYPDFVKEKNPPANTLLGVTSLARPEFGLEIQVVAAIP